MYKGVLVLVSSVDIASQHGTDDIRSGSEHLRQSLGTNSQPVPEILPKSALGPISKVKVQEAGHHLTEPSSQIKSQDRTSDTARTATPHQPPCVSERMHI